MKTDINNCDLAPGKLYRVYSKFYLETEYPGKTCVMLISNIDDTSTDEEKPNGTVVMFLSTVDEVFYEEPSPHSSGRPYKVHKILWNGKIYFILQTYRFIPVTHV